MNINKNKNIFYLSLKDGSLLFLIIIFTLIFYIFFIFLVSFSLFNFNIFLFVLRIFLIIWFYLNYILKYTNIFNFFFNFIHISLKWKLKFTFNLRNSTLIKCFFIFFDIFLFLLWNNKRVLPPFYFLLSRDYE